MRHHTFDSRSWGRDQSTSHLPGTLMVGAIAISTVALIVLLAMLPAGEAVGIVFGALVLVCLVACGGAAYAGFRLQRDVDGLRSRLDERRSQRS